MAHKPNFRNSKHRSNVIIKLRERDGDNCSICHILMDLAIPSGKEMVTVDHKIPISDGGKNDLENLRLAHMICNSNRGNDHNYEDLMKRKKEDDIKYAQVREEARLRKETKMAGING